jgi:hypothetical protein
MMYDPATQETIVLAKVWPLLRCSRQHISPICNAVHPALYLIAPVPVLVIFLSVLMFDQRALCCHQQPVLTSACPDR